MHGGDEFIAPCLLTEAVLGKLKRLERLAPLHQPHNLAAVNAMARLRPELPQIGSFDTAFHRTMELTVRRYGLPREADLVFDVRCLPNPHFVPTLKRRTGRDRAVVAFMERDKSAREFMNRLEEYVRFVVPYYISEGKAYLTVAIGCTGGRHRSVMIAERLRRSLNIPGASVRVRHRDIKRS